jgi:hypothetical protein
MAGSQIGTQLDLHVTGIEREGEVFIGHGDSPVIARTI